MVKIENVAWGKVRIDSQDYWQVLVVDKKVIPREVERVKQQYGTDHVVADWEQKELLSNKPDIILIANGWSGLLEVAEEFKNKIESLNIELKVVSTPKVITEYNQLIKQGKKVNCLIHTTC